MEHVVRHHESGDREFTGFWIYIMSDCLLFATLFASFAVLRNNTFGGPGGGELFSAPFVLLETLVLLTSSFTCGLAILSSYKRQKGRVIGWLFMTLLLGASFLGLEINEFVKLVLEGNGFTRSGFLSSFFTLVGTHGLHVFFGSLWMIILIIQIAFIGLTQTTLRRLTLLTLFWHFLDVIWIFIFTVVYLMGIVM